MKIEHEQSERMRMIIDSKCIACDPFFTINEMFDALEKVLPTLEQLCPGLRDRQFRGTILFTDAYTTQQQFFFVGGLPKKEFGELRTHAIHLCRVMVRCNRVQSYGKAQDGSDVEPGGITLGPPPPIWLAFHGPQPPPRYLAIIGSTDAWANHALALWLAVHFRFLALSEAETYARACDTPNPYYFDLVVKAKP